MTALNKDDLDYLWTHLGELARAARTGDNLRLQQLVARLVAESADPTAMSEACVDAIERLTHEHPGLALARPAGADRAGLIGVGDVVTAVAPPQWAGRDGLVVFIDPQAAKYPIGVEFRLGDDVAIWMFAADQLRRPGS